MWRTIDLRIGTKVGPCLSEMRLMSLHVHGHTCFSCTNGHILFAVGGVVVLPSFSDYARDRKCVNGKLYRRLLRWSRARPRAREGREYGTTSRYSCAYADLDSVCSRSYSTLDEKGGRVCVATFSIYSTTLVLAFGNRFSCYSTSGTTSVMVVTVADECLRP